MECEFGEWESEEEGEEEEAEEEAIEEAEEGESGVGLGKESEEGWEEVDGLRWFMTSEEEAKNPPRPAKNKKKAPKTTTL